MDSITLSIILTASAILLVLFLLRDKTQPFSATPLSLYLIRNRGIKEHYQAVRFLADKDNYATRRIMSGEQAFFELLRDALSDCHILPLVSFSAFITYAPHVTDVKWQKLICSKFNAKYADFVICRKSDFSIVAIIEYSGSNNVSHGDALLATLGYRVERFSPEDTCDSVKRRFKSA